MRTRLALLVGSVVLGMAAWSAVSQDKSPPQSSGAKSTSTNQAASSIPVKAAKAAADYPVICYLEQRDRTITVKAGPKGPLYSVKAADGKVLYDNLPLDQLSAKAPQLGEFIKTSVVGASGAKGDARLRIKVDASLRHSAAR